MSKKDRPLPKPPKTPFGTARPSSEHGAENLLSDRMAEAAVQGKLDEFLRSELPDSEEARTLARMMMGMSGMMPEGMGSPQDVAGGATASGAKKDEDQAPQSQEVPEEVAHMVQSGDVKGLMDVLRREHEKRSPGSVRQDAAEAGPAQEAAAPQPSGMPAIDRELIDAMIGIAKDNSVSVDWIILRAIKVYVEEYRKTGKL